MTKGLQQILKKLDAIFAASGGGLSEAQVQALIDASAPSGGVIGTAVITIDNADAVTVDYIDGVFTGVTDLNFVYGSGSGELVVTTIEATGAQYFPLVTWESTASLTMSLKLLAESAFTSVFLNSTTGAAAGTAVDVVRISILKLSQ